MSYMHPSWLHSLLCHTGPCTFCSMSSHPLMMLLFTGICTPLESPVKTYLGNLVHVGPTAVLSWVLVAACLLVLTLSEMQAYTLVRNYLTKEWNGGASEKTSIFVKLQFFLSAYLSTLCNVSTWSLPWSLMFATKMSSVIPRTFGIPLKEFACLLLEHVNPRNFSEWQLYISVPAKWTTEHW